MVFSTKQVLEYTGLSAHTFKRYRELLGIMPRKMYGVRGRFYFFHEIVAVMELRMPQDGLYRARVLDRYDAMRRAKEQEGLATAKREQEAGESNKKGQSGMPNATLPRD
jgi:hypothetical protein